jgi:choline dehydrogenase-like flavoprotein
VKVLFDGNKRAVGVEFTPNPDYQDESVPRPKGSIRARKLVVVSCGACSTPGVLERSGVGAKSVLEKAGVPVVVDLPGLGNDYQDHNLVFYPFRTNLEPHETMDEVLRVKEVRDKMVSEKRALLRWNTCDVAMKIRPTEKEVDELGPEFRKVWNRDFRDAPNRPIMLLSLVSR